MSITTTHRRFDVVDYDVDALQAVERAVHAALDAAEIRGYRQDHEVTVKVRVEVWCEPDPQYGADVKCERCGTWSRRVDPDAGLCVVCVANNDDRVVL